MTRPLRIFLIAYAATMIACTASLGKNSFSEPDMTWFLFGYAAVSYLALALDQIFTSDREGTPRRTVLGVMFAAALSLPVVFYFETSPSERSIRLTSMLVVAVPAYLFCTGVLLHRLKAERKHKRDRAWQLVVASALVVSAAMVLASVSLNTTDSARGWSIVSLKAKWITSEVNVATGIFGPQIAWLRPFYKPGGYVFYLLALIATMTMLIGLAASQMRLNVRESAGFRASLLIINIAGFWVLNDIFWGWHFDLSNNPVAATIATALWLAGPLFVIVLIVPLLWRKNDVWRLRTLLAFQVPIGAFNMVIIGEYWGSDVLNLPGLGLLILGLQLESLACIELLASRAHGKATVLELQGEHALQTHSMAA